MDEDRVLAELASLRDAVTSQFEGLEQKLVRTEEKLLRMDHEHVTFRVEVISRFDRIEDRLTNMAEDLTLTMNAVSAEAKRRRVDRSEMADMAEMLAGMQRQIMRLRTDVDGLQPPPRSI